MDENKAEFQMATPVVISPTPIDVSTIQLDNKEGAINAYLVVHNYPSVEMVEGLILIIYHDNGATPLPHVWNKIDDIHFDVTAEKKWPGNEKLNEVKSIHYFSVMTHKKSDFEQDNNFEYCYATRENSAAIIDALVNGQLSMN